MLVERHYPPAAPFVETHLSLLAVISSRQQGSVQQQHSQATFAYVKAFMHSVLFSLAFYPGKGVTGEMPPNPHPFQPL